MAIMPFWSKLDRGLASGECVDEVHQARGKEEMEKRRGDVERRGERDADFPLVYMPSLLAILVERLS
jgi:hypothetical protein